MVDHYLSGWFCYAQSDEGQVVSVFHSQDEDMEAVNFKKGIAAAFQANFRGTEEAVEIDSQSKHMSHYRFAHCFSMNVAIALTHFLIFEHVVYNCRAP